MTHCERVCVCVCVCVCMCVAFFGLQTCVQNCDHLHAYIQMCVCKHMFFCRCVSPCVCVCVCGGLDWISQCVCVMRWSLLSIPYRGIKRVFPLKKQQRTKGPLTRQCVLVCVSVCVCVCVCVCVRVEGGLALQVLDPLNSPQLWPTASEAWQYHVCV